MQGTKKKRRETHTFDIHDDGEEEKHWVGDVLRGTASPLALLEQMEKRS
jgi:hypothetical protein